MGLHTAELMPTAGDYVGLDVHRAARICSAGHGGQTLVSEAVKRAVGDSLPPNTLLEDLGEHRLKDIVVPERMYQVTAPDLPSAFPPLRTVVPRPTNIPIQRGALFGREREITTVRRLLLRDDVGLVTLTGTGGAGKTSLAMRVAGQLINHFEHGAFLVALAPIDDPSLVSRAIVQVLGIHESASRSHLDSIKETVQTRQILLVLDNFEQVLDAAMVVTELLESCPRLKILVTSRSPLQLRGEREVPILPLALPDPATSQPIAALRQNPAVALFIERAGAVQPDFELTAENARTVADICVRLDGLPLALELAAARIKHLPARSMLARLRDSRRDARLAVLFQGPRDLPQRHQTLRAAIAWSYDLLSEAEQDLFRQLSVFVGGWTIEAVEAVVSSPALVALGAEANVTNLLASLVDKNLVYQEEDAAGEVRFGMLETIREFAMVDLAAKAEEAVTRRAHARFYLELAEQADRELRGPRQMEWVARVVTEYDNLRAALTWCLGEEKEREWAAQLASSLWQFWELRALYREGGEWLARILAADGSLSTAARAKLLAASGILARHMNGHLTRPWLEESADLFEQLGDRAGVAWALSHLGMVAQYEGDNDRAISVLTLSVAIYRALGDRWGLGTALVNLGCALKTQRKFQQSKPPLEEGLSHRRALGDTWGIARTLGFLAHTMRELGDLDRVAVLCDEALPLCRQLDSPYATTLVLESMAHVAEARGDVDRAVELLHECLVLRHIAGSAPTVAAAVQRLAVVAVRRGALEHATRLFAAAEAVLSAASLAMSTAGRAPFEPELASLRATLGPDRFEAAWAAGSALTIDQVIEEVLADVAPTVSDMDLTSYPTMIGPRRTNHFMDDAGQEPPRTPLAGRSQDESGPQPAVPCR